MSPADTCILIVDDVETNRAMLSRRLKRRGYAIREAESGRAALDLIAAEPVDLVLLDWMMPGMSGLDVLRELRGTHSETMLPVIMVTAKSESEGVVEAIELGANDYVTKPIDFKVALARLQTQLSRRAATLALSRANETLEARVRERTHELEMSNGQLEREIEQHRLTETALRLATERAESANEAKSRFLANMSHELRTPLNAIIGFSELIRTQMARASCDEKLGEYAGYILDSGRHLLAVVNDILDLSKVESKTTAMNEESVHVGEFLHEAARLVQPQAQGRGIAIDIADDGSVGRLWVDATLMKRVVVNLIANAVKFSHDGHRVEIRVGSAAYGEIQLAVVDTGIGIAADNLVKVLEPFAQVEQGLERRYEGTGLGLPLAKSLTELHGGRLEIESAPGAGTTVTVILPPDRRRGAAAEETEETRIAQAG